MWSSLHSRYPNRTFPEEEERSRGFYAFSPVPITCTKKRRESQKIKQSIPENTKHELYKSDCPITSLNCSMKTSEGSATDLLNGEQNFGGGGGKMDSYQITVKSCCSLFAHLPFLLLSLNGEKTVGQVEYPFLGTLSLHHGF